MVKKLLVAVLGSEGYRKFVILPNKLYHSFLPFKFRGKDIFRRYLIPEGGVVLDIGANLGRFTGFAAPLVGRSGRVYSFEPVGMASGTLKRMVALRRLRQVVVAEVALSDKAGTSDITIPLKDRWKPSLQTAHLGGTPGANTMQVTVTLQRLDDYCAAENIERVDFIKCDTEGYEYHVFGGGLKTLARDKPHIFCEVERPYVERIGLQPDAVFERLGALGYRSYRYATGGKLVAVAGYQKRGDYFFLHPSRLDDRLSAIIV
jgi:FkbM family methyltransferase